MRFFQTIEVNWVAFNKEQEDFHIPDGEDDIYLKKLLDKAELEDDLISAGYLEPSMFAMTNPNETSLEDTNEYKLKLLLEELEQKKIHENINKPSRLSLIKF